MVDLGTIITGVKSSRDFYTGESVREVKMEVKEGVPNKRVV